MRPILRWPDARLSAAAAPVGAGGGSHRAGDGSRLVADLFDTMYAAPGRGLAAPQLGVLARVFVMDVTWKEGARSPRVFVDPEVVWASDARATGPEGCLSIPGLTVEVTRPARVRLAFYDAAGLRREEAFEGFAAACVQHELDHLDGIVTFDRLDPSARAAAEAAYRP